MTDAIIHLSAGTVAGMTGVLFDFPLDTIKTHMQVGGGAIGSHHGRLSSYGQCTTRLYHGGGLRAFYRGISVPLAAQGAEAAAVFTVYNTSLQHFIDQQRRRQHERKQKKLQSLGDCQGHARRPAIELQQARSQREPTPVWCSFAHWKASACAGFAVSLILTPVEMLKCGLQVESNRPCWQRRHTTVRGLARNLVTTHGMASLYTGMTGTMARAVVGNMAYFVSYEQFKQWLALTHGASGGASPVPMWHSMLAGGLSGCCYWTIAYPADVAKTKMQVCQKARQRGFTRVLAGLYRSEGVKGLYRGWRITVARAFLSSSIVFPTYENCSRMLQKAPLVFDEPAQPPSTTLAPAGAT